MISEREEVLPRPLVQPTSHSGLAYALCNFTTSSRFEVQSLTQLQCQIFPFVCFLHECAGDGRLHPPPHRPLQQASLYKFHEQRARVAANMKKHLTIVIKLGT